MTPRPEKIRAATPAIDALDKELAVREALDPTFFADLKQKSVAAWVMSDNVKTQLQALGDNIEFYEELQRSHDYDAMARAWVERFGQVTPAEMFKTLRKGFDSLMITLSSTKAPPQSQDFGLTLKDGATEMLVSLTLEHQPSMAQASSLLLDNIDIIPARASGAKKLLENLHDLRGKYYPALQKLEATMLETGSYAWARFGSLGRYMLLNAHWKGNLDFNDKQAMERFTGYLARLGITRDISGPGVMGRSGGN